MHWMFLFVRFCLFVCMFPVPVQTPSVSPSSIVLPPYNRALKICNEHINSPASYKRSFTQKAFKTSKKICLQEGNGKFRHQLRAKLEETGTPVKMK